MGTGKTVISIAASEKLLDVGEINCCLVVCSASLKYQWAQRLAQFTDLPVVEKKLRDETIIIPASDCFIIDGSKKNRDYLYRIITADGWRPRYIIMGYDNVVNDYNWVAKIKPDMVVLDEATAIKTFKAQRTKRIKKVLKSPYRLALTGTPIENRPDELFSLMQWVDESVLGRYDLFEKAYIKRNKYGWVVRYINLPVLRKRMSVAMVRKSREDPDVKPFLPEIDEKNWNYNLTPEMFELYTHISKDMLKELDKLTISGDFDVHDFYAGKGKQSSVPGRLAGMYMCLEMLLDHPDLLIYSAQLYEKGDGDGSSYAFNLWQHGLIDDVLISPKLDKLVSNAEDVLADDSSKILIFSKYKYMLTIIEERLSHYGCVQFHGDMSPSHKAAAVARYSNDPECRVFLSSHAGAYGMDMSMANHLTNYDLPWSAGLAEQINGRHDRASSEFDLIYIRNMIAEGTIEERKLRVVNRKRAIASAVLDGHGANEFGRIDVEGDSLRECLTKGLIPGRIVTV